MQQHGSNYFARRPPPPPPPPYNPVGIRVKCRNSTFSEHGHVAYQIKENHEINAATWKQIFRPQTALPPPPCWEWVNRSKFIFFRSWSCCISNKRELQNAAAW